MNFVDSRCARLTTSKRWSMALTLAMALFAATFSACSAQRIVSAQPAHKKLVDHTISFSFNQSTVNNGFCSSTVTTSCISGFNEGFLSGTAHNQLHTDLPAICSGTTQPLSCASTFNGLLPIGSIVFYVDTTYVDQNGVAGVTTDALSAAVQVPADTASNVVVTVKP